MALALAEGAAPTLAPQVRVDIAPDHACALFPSRPEAALPVGDLHRHAAVAVDLLLDHPVRPAFAAHTASVERVVEMGSRWHRHDNSRVDERRREGYGRRMTENEIPALHWLERFAQHPDDCAVWVELDDVTGHLHPVGNCTCGLSDLIGDEVPGCERHLGRPMYLCKDCASKEVKV